MVSSIALFQAVGVSNPGAYIDWELTPADTFGTFESWGGRERVRNNSERFYYFYIDGWQSPPVVCLMERAVKHARPLARIAAPTELVAACIAGQGELITLDRSYAVDGPLKHWLRFHLIDSFDPGLVAPIPPEQPVEAHQSGLPRTGTVQSLGRITLPACASLLSEAQAAALVRSGGFHDRDLNPAGHFPAQLVDNGDGLTVTDLRTGLMWQRGGYDQVNTYRQVCRYTERMNAERHAGHDGWRLPTLAEALTLIDPGEKQASGACIHPCFSLQEPFIFTAQQRKPGGRWFVDFLEGRIYWASGSNPGGHARLCRCLRAQGTASPLSSTVPHT
ncbi:MAG: DUF1566 domain-containing protein [Thermodesulfobacteriota bacterium]